MTRAQVLQRIVDAVRGRTYVEIGVAFGATFLHVHARRKIAVDPLLASRALAPDYKRFPEIPRHGYTLRSDAFFARHSRLFKRDKIDVAFVDGLHTYRQSLRDVLNCLRHLSPRGVIVLDDCNPHSEDAARKACGAGNGPWCGDVWKTIVRLRSTRPDLEVCVLDCEQGLGIIRKGLSPANPRLALGDIRGMTYQDLARSRRTLLNLKRPEHVRTIVKALATAAAP